MENKTKLGIALVGLGEYATGQLMPSLRETEYCYLAGLVSGSTEKMEKYGHEFNLNPESLYSYEDFDRIADDPRIDIVYIVLPNAMHAEYAIRAARAGKHVICEKPLAASLEECYRIVNAAAEAGIQFSMGYRLHFDPYHREMMRLGQDEIFGRIRRLELRNSMDIGDQSPWRLDLERSGGGPLVNNGIYCIQAAIYITGQLPSAVEARFAPVTDPVRFAEVEEGIEWTMFFGNDVTAVCETSYSKEQDLMRAEAENGWFELSPAYAYEGLKGRASTGEIQFPPLKQQARQMDNFARCVIQRAETRLPVTMGIRDMEIIAAIYKSAKTGERVALHLEEYAALPES